MQSSAVKRTRNLCACLIVASLMLWTAGASAQFADPNLAAAVQDQLALTPGTIGTMLYLDASGRDITQLNGIEACTSLQTLLADGNRITSVQPLLSMTWLTFIGLTDNPLSEQALCTDIPTILARETTTVTYEESDGDGDGLGVCGETENATDPNDPDSDHDGMSDGYEVDYELEPLDPTDAPEDPDRDGLTNIEESFLRSDPHDPTSPYPAFWVSPSGIDAAGRGTLAAPWRTIQYAINHVSPTSVHPATVLVGEGSYPETVTLKPYVRLQGNAEEAEDVVIQGTMVGAEGATVRNLTIGQAEDKVSDPTILLTLDNVRMLVCDVVFRAEETSQTTGIVFRGDGPAQALVTDCTLCELHRGMEIFGALPTVRRTLFHGISEHGIIIRAVTPEPTTNGSLGDELDPNTGWNTFQEIGGKDVLNERSHAITMQRTNWSGDDPPAHISGSITYYPPLAAGTPLLPGSIVCSVSDAGDKHPITNGKVNISGFSPVTSNVNGVYTIACLAAGNYGLGVTATGYINASRNVAAKSGELTAVVMPIKTLGTGEGEGEGEPPSSCIGGSLDAQRLPPAPPWQSGDGLLLAALAVTLAVIAVVFRKQPA